MMYLATSAFQYRDTKDPQDTRCRIRNADKVQPTKVYPDNASLRDHNNSTWKKLSYFQLVTISLHREYYCRYVYNLYQSQFGFEDCRSPPDLIRRTRPIVTRDLR
jgi:hypothetical protein